MVQDPKLRGISALIFDEFHERHLYGDVTLARALDLQETERPDLKLLVMSATLDRSLLETYLQPCRTLESLGRNFSVDVKFSATPSYVDKRPVWEQAADAFTGYDAIFLGPHATIQEVACWAHARRPFFAMADIEANARRKAAGKKEIPLSPIAMEIVRRIDALFAIERSINGKSAEERLAVRQAVSRPLVDAFENYMRDQVAKLSRGHDLAKAMQYMLKRWSAFTLFLEDGRVCLSNNAAERGLRGIALGRKSWLFCGSDRGGQRAAAMYSLIVTAKMNGVDPQAWLADVLARINDHNVQKLDQLLPWNWKSEPAKLAEWKAKAGAMASTGRTPS